MHARMRITTPTRNLRAPRSSKTLDHTARLRRRPLQRHCKMQELRTRKVSLFGFVVQEDRVGLDGAALNGDLSSIRGIEEAENSVLREVG